MNNKTKILILSIVLYTFALPVFALEVDYPTIAGQTPGDTLPQYIKYVFTFFVAAAGFMALLVLAIGSAEYMGSAGDVGKMRNAKAKISSSLFGILILLSSYVILYTINPNLTNLEGPTIAEVASKKLPPVPISAVATADLLTRIKVLAEDTQKIPEIVYASAKLLSSLTNQCDCEKTKPMCGCEETLKCPETPWYTAYNHMDKIYYKPYGELDEGSDPLSVGRELNRGDVVGQVGEKATDTGPHLHFEVGFNDTPGSYIAGGSHIISFDVTSKVRAPGGIKGTWTEGSAQSKLPSYVSQSDVNYILKTLISPLFFSHCVWYENKNSYVHTGNQYWAQDWRCLSDESTESGEVRVMSGNIPVYKSSDMNVGNEIKSVVENIDESTGSVIIKHYCPTPTPTPTPTPDSPGAFNNLTKKPLIASLQEEKKMEPIKIESLASIESLADITCPEGTAHYFYDNNTKEGCCEINFGFELFGKEGNQVCCHWRNSPHYFFDNYTKEACCEIPPNTSAADSLCGPPGNQKCCAAANGKKCVSDGDNTTCCSSLYACSFGDKGACCNADKPSCKYADFNISPLEKYSQAFCCSLTDDYLCYSPTSKKTPACCPRAWPLGSNCVETAKDFSCCNLETSIRCGDPGHQICCEDPDGILADNDVPGNTKNVSCGGTNINPTCNVTDRLNCDAGQFRCGEEKGYQACCNRGDTCIAYNHFDQNGSHAKGFCIPPDIPFDFNMKNICINSNSKVDRCPDTNTIDVSCCRDGSGIKTTQGCSCCDTGSFIFGTSGFQICCKPKGDDWTVIDGGTWNNPRCVDVRKTPPFDCANGNKCGNYCCQDSEKYCVGSYTYGYACCSSNTERLRVCQNSLSNPPVCCRHDTYDPQTSKIIYGDECLVSLSNKNICCDSKNYTPCYYYLWNHVYMGSTCSCTKNQFCGGTWANPICLQKENPPPCSESRSDFCAYSREDNEPICCGEDGICMHTTYWPYDFCILKPDDRQPCYVDNRTGAIYYCAPDETCVNHERCAKCPPNDSEYKICESKNLKTKACCRKDQICGGTAEAPACIDAPPEPTPILSCDPSEFACNQSEAWGPISETATCCPSGQDCYLEDKDGNPFPLQYYNMYKWYLPNSIGKCCDTSTNNLYIPGRDLEYLGSRTYGLYGVCCPKNVDIVTDANGIAKCCGENEWGYGTGSTTDVIRDEDGNRQRGTTFGQGICCKEGEIPSQDYSKCEKIPTYCESPVPDPIDGVYPKACDCSPTPTPTPTPSPSVLKCENQTVFAGDKYHPCGEDGFRELIYLQGQVVSKKDVLVYYKNRLRAEKNDLKVDIERYVNPTLDWFCKEIKRRTKLLTEKTSTPRSATEKQIEFLNERKSWLEEEKQYKEQLVREIEEAEKSLEQFDYISSNVSQLPDKCLSNVSLACTSVCTADGLVPSNNKGFAGEDNKDIILNSEGNPLGNYGCHNAFWGCKPVKSEGGNPCPVDEIDAEAEKLAKLNFEVKSAFDQIIYTILKIKKERIPKITF